MKINRPDHLNWLIQHQHSPTIQWITGPAGSGKTWLMRNLFIPHLIESGIPEKQILYYTPKPADAKMPAESAGKLLQQAEQNISILIIDSADTFKTPEKLRTFLNVLYSANADGTPSPQRSFTLYLTGTNMELPHNPLLQHLPIQQRTLFPFSWKEVSAEVPEDRLQKRWEFYQQYGGLPLLYEKEYDPSRIPDLILQFIQNELPGSSSASALNTERTVQLIELCTRFTGKEITVTELRNTFLSHTIHPTHPYTINRLLDSLIHRGILIEQNRYNWRKKKINATPASYWLTDHGIQQALNPNKSILPVLVSELVKNGWKVLSGRFQTNKGAFSIDILAERERQKLILQTLDEDLPQNEIQKRITALKKAPFPGEKYLIASHDLTVPKDPNFEAISLYSFIQNVLNGFQQPLNHIPEKNPERTPCSLHSVKDSISSPFKQAFQTVWQTCQTTPFSIKKNTQYQIRFPVQPKTIKETWLLSLFLPEYAGSFLQLLQINNGNEINQNLLKSFTSFYSITPEILISGFLHTGLIECTETDTDILLKVVIPQKTEEFICKFLPESLHSSAVQHLNAMKKILSEQNQNNAIPSVQPVVHPSQNNSHSASIKDPASTRQKTSANIKESEEPFMDPALAGLMEELENPENFFPDNAEENTEPDLPWIESNTASEPSVPKKEKPEKPAKTHAKKQESKKKPSSFSIFPVPDSFTPEQYRFNFHTFYSTTSIRSWPEKYRTPENERAIAWFSRLHALDQQDTKKILLGAMTGTMHPELDCANIIPYLYSQPMYTKYLPYSQNPDDLFPMEYLHYAMPENTEIPYELRDLITNIFPNHYRLEPGAIKTLIDYCIQNSPGIIHPHYIAKIGKDWNRRNIHTAEQAREALRFPKKQSIIQQSDVPPEPAPLPAYYSNQETHPMSDEALADVLKALEDTSFNNY